MVTASKQHFIMKILYLLLTATLLFSCNWFKQKTKETVNKTGEVVAKTGSEFVNGISKGIEKTFRNKAVFSDELIKEGLQSGKITIRSSDSANDNIVTVYLIFNKDFNRKIMVKVFNEDGLEYGRASQIVKGEKDEAKYIDFLFDKRTNIDGRGKVTFE